MTSIPVASPLDFRASVPFGSDLRVLLNSDMISPGDIHDLLQEKGVFVGTSEKQVTVPILSSTLLTPPEFVRLIEASVSRELAPKVRTYQYDLERVDADWVAAIRQEFKGDSFASLIDTTGNIKIKSAPTITLEGKDRLRISYTLSRQDFSQDWIRREVEYPGEIILEQKGSGLVLEAALSRTSKDTNDFNRRILGRAASALKKGNFIKKEEANKITYASFEDSERVLFFKKLTAGTAGSLELGSVNDMEIGRDEGMPELPDDPKISWMNQTVRKIIIDGERLNDIFLISDDQYYEYYYIQRMDVTFKYIFGQNSGTARISFHFTPSKPEERLQAEFEFEVVRATPAKGRMNSDAKREVRKLLHRAVQDLIDREYNSIVAARVPIPTAPAVPKPA